LVKKRGGRALLDDEGKGIFINKYEKIRINIDDFRLVTDSRAKIPKKYTKYTLNICFSTKSTNQRPAGFCSCSSSFLTHFSFNGYLIWKKWKLYLKCKFG
jgi:hypothetical protein